MASSPYEGSIWSSKIMTGIGIISPVKDDESRDI